MPRRPVKDAKPRPCAKCTILLELGACQWRGPYHAHCPSRWCQCRCSSQDVRVIGNSTLKLPAFNLKFLRKATVELTSLAIMGPNLGVSLYPRGVLTVLTSAWSPISANRGRRRGSVPDSGQIGEGRGRGSVPAPGQIRDEGPVPVPGQIGDGDGDGGPPGCQRPGPIDRKLIMIRRDKFKDT
jgi:hypothetical protein